MRMPNLAATLLIACGGSSQTAPTSTMDTAQTVHPAPTAPSVTPTATPGGPSLTVVPGSGPQLLEGLAQGGSVSQEPNCPGHFTSDPSLTVFASSPMATLRFVVNAGVVSDTTLRVQGADGINHCNDDFEHYNPAVTVPSASGMYQVWVGTYSQGQSIPYSIGVSENPGLATADVPAPAGAQTGPDRTPPPDMGTRSTSGTITLRPGFLPDPHAVTAPELAMGSDELDTNGWDPSCNGLARPVPDHLLVLQQDFSHLAIVAKSSQDITLVVQNPDGSYTCNDDYEDLNPGVGGPMARGTYKIWVGLYSSEGRRDSYVLGLSESEGLMPSMLGGTPSTSTAPSSTTPSPFTDVTPN